MEEADGDADDMRRVVDRLESNPYNRVCDRTSHRNAPSLYAEFHRMPDTRAGANLNAAALLW